MHIEQAIHSPIDSICNDFQFIHWVFLCVQMDVQKRREWEKKREVPTYCKIRARENAIHLQTAQCAFKSSWPFFLCLYKMLYMHTYSYAFCSRACKNRQWSYDNLMNFSLHNSQISARNHEVKCKQQNNEMHKKRMTGKDGGLVVRSKVTHFWSSLWLYGLFVCGFKKVVALNLI